jgi:uncharacterized protein DUF6582
MDPNPGRGMPAALQRYWLVGKGAAKIRWHMPHDFDRCVRNLRKYFPKNPEGLCNILHQKAVGAPPGKGHGHALTASLHGTDQADALTAAQELLDRQPHLGRYQWAGPLAPIGRPTGEPRRTRVFEPGSLQHRVLPLPLDWRKKSGPGHDGGVTVGRILGVAMGPDHQGQDYCWGWGDYLDEEIIPEAKEARYLATMGVAGPSLDPGGKVMVAVNPETGFEHMTLYVFGGATMVSIPAFAALRQHVFEEGGDWPDDDPDMAIEADDDCGCAGTAQGSMAGPAVRVALGPSQSTFAVNAKGWRGLPLAPRNAVFDNDDAVKRIAAWAASGGQGPDVDKLRRAFMWYDPQLPPTDPTSYRLPVGDIINGRLTLIFHAIYAAAALLSGAHGGLPGIDENDRGELRNVISEIYPEMATAFNDSSIRAPWDRSAAEGVQLATDAQEPYGDVDYADPGYRGKKRYPIDTPEHIRAAWAYINVPRNAAEYETHQLVRIKAKIQAAAKKAGIQIGESMSADTFAVTDEGFPLAPPKAWFDDPQLTRKTKLTVEPNGRVYGHLAAWNECHRDVTQRECVLAPHSKQGYAPFHLGAVYSAEGELIEVGKIVQDTRHAHIGLGYTAAALHYDNTGDDIAVVRAGEDEFGIWVAGSVVPEATKRKVAKLRRSPLSGDWRREKGSLELTAALAVNTPAFPVYAMENDEQLALVAAGSVWFDEEDTVDDTYTAEPDYTPPPTGIVPMLERLIEQHFATDNDRTERFRDILEDEEIYKQRERSQRLQQLFAVSDEPAPAPAPAPAPVAAPIPAAPPVSGGDGGQQQMAVDPTAIALAEQMNARFAVVAEPNAQAAETTPAPAPVPAPVPAAAPAPAAPVTPAPAQ